MNLGIRGDRVENVLWRAIDLSLPSSVKNIVILCGTNNIPIYTTRDIADCIISIGSIFRKKSNDINVSACVLILRDECWSVNRVLINEVDEILKYQCNINGFAFNFQYYGWTLANGSLDCSLFYKDLLHLFEQGNVNQANSMTLTITHPRYNHINLSSTNSNTPLNVSKPVCSSNPTKRNICNTNNVSQLVKPLNVRKTACFNNATERNICKVSSVSQLIQPVRKRTDVNRKRSHERLAKKRAVTNTILQNHLVP